MDFLIFLIVIIIFFTTYTYWRFKDLPSGPYGLPFLGYALFIGKNAKERQETFIKLTKKYGKIYSINLLNEPVVVVNDWETIHEVLVKQGTTFSGRPYNFLMEWVLERKEPSSAHGPIWKEQKRFCIKILQQLGMSKLSMENVIMDEVEDITKELNLQNGKSFQMSSIFFVPILNVIWRLTAGKRFDVSDLSGVAFQCSMKDLMAVSAHADLLNVFPVLRYVFPGMIGYTKICKAKQIICNYLEHEINLHMEKFEENSVKDFIDFYLAEIKAKNGAKPFNKEHLLFTLFVLFGAGTDPTNAQLTWAILYMVLNPDVQLKVQQELDPVIGENEYLSVTSKSLVPYTEATILEIFRMSTISPLALPHMSLKETTLEGYKIPKGTTILTNLWNIHHDEEYWGDPDIFRPERFLDENGIIKKDTHLLPFSAGPRLCLGDSLARKEIFLFFTCLMHRFSFQIIPGQTKPSLDPVGGMSVTPKPYSVMVYRRK